MSRVVAADAEDDDWVAAADAEDDAVDTEDGEWVLVSPADAAPSRQPAPAPSSPLWTREPANPELPLQTQLYCFFLAIASVLGTGILAMPVELYETGFLPFLATFSLALVAQIGAVMMMVELLQRVRVMLSTSANAAPTAARTDDEQRLLGTDFDEAEGGDEDGVVEAIELTRIGGAQQPAEAFREEDAFREDAEQQPDLYRMGALLLQPGGQWLFTGAVYLHFTSLLISYALAFSKALGQLLGVAPVLLVAPFVLVFASLVTFCFGRIQPVISLLASVKTGMLIGMIAVAGYLGASVGEHATNSFGSIGGPFLIGTLALGGVINVLPVMYSRLSAYSALALRQFRRAVVGGIVACFMLNCFW